MNLVSRYVHFLEQFLKVEGKVKVVFDCSDGATGPIIRDLFENHPQVEAIIYNAVPNGEFPAHGPNPLAPEAIADLEREVKENNADLGVIFDGDGDRVAFADNQGELIDPYTTLTLMKDQFKPPYVVDSRALAEFTMPELDVIEERVGRYFIIKTMRKYKAELGGEYTGHYYFKDFFYADKFPEITFKSISTIKTEEHTYKIKGDLTMRGITKPIELTATCHEKKQLANGKTRMDLTAEGSVNRN